MSDCRRCGHPRPKFRAKVVGHENVYYEFCAKCMVSNDLAPTCDRCASRTAKIGVMFRKKLFHLCGDCVNELGSLNEYIFGGRQ